MKIQTDYVGYTFIRAIGACVLKASTKESHPKPIPYKRWPIPLALSFEWIDTRLVKPLGRLPLDASFRLTSSFCDFGSSGRFTFLVAFFKRTITSGQCRKNT